MHPPNCHKDGHTYDGARNVIKKMTWKARRQGRTIQSQKIYKCPFCKAFHTTSHSYDIPNPKKEMSN